MVALELCTFTFLSAFLYWQLLDNWTGIFWFSHFSSINAFTNCSGIVGLPSTIICSLVFWTFSSFSVYFWWHSGNGSSVWHLFAVWYFVFVIVFVIWRIFYLAFVWQLCCISVAVSLSTVVTFKSQREGNSTKASSKLFVSWPCKLSQPVEGFDNASVPEYFRDLL